MQTLREFAPVATIILPALDFAGISVDTDYVEQGFLRCGLRSLIQMQSSCARFRAGVIGKSCQRWLTHLLNSAIYLLPHRIAHAAVWVYAAICLR